LPIRRQFPGNPAIGAQRRSAAVATMREAVKAEDPCTDGEGGARYLANRKEEGTMANIIRRNEREGRDLGNRTRGQGGEFANRGSFLDPFRLMGELMRWDPFGGEGIDRLGMPAGGFMPSVDVREGADGYHFRVDLPGVKDENVDISLTGNRLTISGHREDEKRDEGDRYHAYECTYGSFSRSFTLPDGTDSENVRADMKDGVLNVTVPKRPEVQPRRIPIGGGQGRGGDGEKGGGAQKS
jgi:HSP20 family protein